jgi:penicillin-binding protein 1A
MQKILKILRVTFKVVIALVILLCVSVVGLYMYVEPELPSIEGLKDVQLQVPLRVYSAEGGLIAEFGEKRRSPKALEEIPLRLREAFLAAEDDRFYEHPGVDYQGIVRAALHLISTGERGQGGSTITMQLARNFYLTSEKTFSRKLNEVFLSFKIEQLLTKDEILALYLNKIYLGNRAYGVAAAAQVYYGKTLDDLDLAQMAMIAGLPKAPSKYNPIVNAERATERRDYVLGRMLTLKYISDDDYKQAIAQPENSGLHDTPIDLSAAYVAEMVRAEMVKQYGEDAYTRGLKVYTTVTQDFQDAANNSLHHALFEYDQRHGYRGPEKREKLEAADKAANAEERSAIWEQTLEGINEYGGLMPALVIDVAEKSARVYMRGGQLAELDWDAMAWAGRYIDSNTIGTLPEKASDVVKSGDVVRVYLDDAKHLRLGQLPDAQAAIVALNPNDGAIRALVGGFDFYQSKFNRAVQTKRQAGSSFKPFIYAAALEKGFTAASVINDAPVVFNDDALEGTWRPENYSGEFYGPTRLREALVNSRNLVSIRLLRAISVQYATQYVSKFGFDENFLPHDLSLALGSCEVSPLELATGFAVFANGGYKVTPYFITRVDDLNGAVLFEVEPEAACVPCAISERKALPAPVVPQTADAAAQSPAGPKLPKQAPRVIEDARVVYVMNSIMEDVITRGTAKAATSLGRNDLRGKTGTTNEQRDAWFSGFNSQMVAISWVGFDQQQRQLGNAETGGRAALPLWIDFMRVALKGVPEKEMERPDNLVTVKINPDTGELARAGDPKAIFEMFPAELAPKENERPTLPAGAEEGTNGQMPEQLF